MLTKTMHAGMARMGSNGWQCGISTARLSSDPRSGLMAFLTAYQGSVCAFCGDKETHMELCHIVPGGAARKGWIAGNLAMGCRTCNEIDGDSVIAFASIKRPDLVADSWPDIPTLGEMGRDAKRENEMRRIRKRAKRGM